MMKNMQMTVLANAGLPTESDAIRFLDSVRSMTPGEDPKAVDDVTVLVESKTDQVKQKPEEKMPEVKPEENVKKPEVKKSEEKPEKKPEEKVELKKLQTEHPEVWKAVKDTFKDESIEEQLRVFKQRIAKKAFAEWNRQHSLQTQQKGLSAKAALRQPMLDLCAEAVKEYHDSGHKHSIDMTKCILEACGVPLDEVADGDCHTPVTLAMKEGKEQVTTRPAVLEAFVIAEAARALQSWKDGKKEPLEDLCRLAHQCYHDKRKHPFFLDLKMTEIICKVAMPKGFVPNQKTPLCVAIELGCPQIVEAFLKVGATIEETSGMFRDEKFTPLYLAVEKGNEKCVSKLLDNRADMNAPQEGFDHHGPKCDTPLHLAIMKAPKPIIRLLLQKLDTREQQDAVETWLKTPGCLASVKTFIEEYIQGHRIPAGAMASSLK